jgi:osmotically inducible lipoprotein OsmB
MSRAGVTCLSHRGDTCAVRGNFFTIALPSSLTRTHRRPTVRTAPPTRRCIARQAMHDSMRQGGSMKNAKIVTLLGVVALAGALQGCSSMTTRDKNTAVGAGVGAVTGALLTGGSSLGTVGGAAIGGVIGNQVGRR